MDSFRYKLSKSREEKGWSQKKLANISGVSQTYISELECGKKTPTITIVHKLSTALGIKNSDLL